MTGRPPPYFPQNALSPPDPKRYKRFKILVGVLLFVLVAIAVGAVVGLMLLLRWMF